MDVGQRLMELAGRLDVEVETDVRALAVDHVDLGEARQLPLAQRILDELVGAERVRAFLPLACARRRRTCTSRGRRSSG